MFLEVGDDFLWWSSILYRGIGWGVYVVFLGILLCRKGKGLELFYLDE